MGLTLGKGERRRPSQLEIDMVTCTWSHAAAATNPNVRAHLDVDPPNHVHTYAPQPYQTINAYICFDCLDMGLTALSFMLSDPTIECPGVFAPPSFVARR